MSKAGWGELCKKFCVLISQILTVQTASKSGKMRAL